MNGDRFVHALAYVLALLVMPLAAVFAMSALTSVAGAQRATARDIPAAMSASNTFVTYVGGDSSARSDSARRIASLASTDLEGGDPERGRRLLREAIARGVPDPRFYEDASLYLAMVNAPAELSRVRAEAVRRFPGRRWPWRGSGG